MNPTDKGSTVVMLSKQHHINKADSQLNNMTCYQQLTTYQTSQYTVEVKRFVSAMFIPELINETLKDFLFLAILEQRNFTLYPKYTNQEIHADPLWF